MAQQLSVASCLSEACADCLRSIEVVVPKGGGHFVPVEVYFDESGGHAGSEILCVAGYLFDRPDAEALTREWNAQLEPYGLPYFRMSECAHGAGPFKALSLRQRIDLQTALIEIVNRYANAGFACTARNKDFPALKVFHPFGGGQYTYCMQMCLAGVRTWLDITKYDGDIAYFFESGHRDQSEANRMMNLMFDDPKARRVFRYASHAFVPKLKCPPVQAADILSWQWYTDKRRSLQGSHTRRKDCEALLAPNKCLTQHADVERTVDVALRAYLASEITPTNRIGLFWRQFQFWKTEFGERLGRLFRRLRL